MLKRSRQAAQQLLKNEGFAYLKLRDYQQKAIQSVETALANNQANCLLAMATGTGKTRTIVTVRGAPLTKAKRSRRTLIKNQNLKTANGRRVPLTDLLGQVVIINAKLPPNKKLTVMHYWIISYGAGFI